MHSTSISAELTFTPLPYLIWVQEIEFPWQPDDTPGMAQYKQNIMVLCVWVIVSCHGNIATALSHEQQNLVS